MAEKKKTDTLVYGVDLTFTREQAKFLVSMSPDEQANSAQRIATVAQFIMAAMADGGMLLSPLDMKRIIEATGLNPERGEDIVQALSGATNMDEGHHVVRVKIDPVYYDGYKEIADAQERTVDQLMQETVDMALENEWVYQVHPDRHPMTVLMSPKDKKDLESCLEGKFSTGSELVALVKTFSGGGLFDDVAAEPTSNVVLAEAQ